MSRSLRASDEGIKQIKKAMKQGNFTQKDLAEALEISRSVITVLLRGEAITRENFEKICDHLILDLSDIRGEDVISDNLETLVQEVKQKIAADVTERCGTMRVLDMTQPVDLDRIYTDVNILEKISGKNRVDCTEILPIGNREDFDRWLMGEIKQRITGLKAFEKHQKMVVLGKPGAGKTTFMKYLAMSCLGGRFHGELVPIFVTLKAYAEERGQPSLENYILTEFQKREVSADVVKRLLKEGRSLILLDGLDEVKKEDDRRVKQDIDQFSRDWLKNRFAITCRIAAREYQFEKFTEVEVADFDDDQIETFVNNWFRERDESKAERMLERLKDNEPVKELAKSPLLLTLLCLVFGERNDFPPKRSELFKEGLDILLKNWDRRRDVDRDLPRHFKGEQIYRNLSSGNKADIIGKIAFNTFVNGEYFFRQEDLQRQIKDYICNLPEASADPDVLLLDSEVVLKAIEHHHGLLVERARNIYSFSHLTFQEYFAAREIERERHFEILVENISNPRWKEVFYLTAEMLRRSDEFLKMMKDCIDGMLAGDEKLQAFLEWAVQKTDSVQAIYKPFAVRAFYAYVDFRTFIIDYERARTLILGFDKVLEQSLDPTPNGLIDQSLAPDLALDLALDLAQIHALYLTLDYNRASALKLHNTLNRALVRALNYATRDDVLQKKLQLLMDSLPSTNHEYKANLEWWRINGKKWISELQNVCINCRNIGHNWELTDEQVKLLLKYYEANYLLVECMNHNDTSKQVRKNIESTLFLPKTLKNSNPIINYKKQF